MSHALALAGCAPTPLASYLKAIGILRLVAEQADPDARGCWSGLGFELISSMNLPALEQFLLEEYRPTPVIAPWNGASGFYPKDNKSGIEPISTAEAPRFANFRDTILLARKILEREGIEERPAGGAKQDLLLLLRNELSESALVWFDATILLTDESPRFPPLLGTGGNDGHLDFTNNFMQRIVGLFDPANGLARAGAATALREALTGVATPGLISAAIGQFAPGAWGGPNGATGFQGGSVVNPWDFVLMLEGAVLFAAAATRRLESSTAATLSYPFTVRSAGSGNGTTALADEAPAHDEIWMPLWTAPASLPELRALFSEGRITLGGRTARDGLDAVRAIAHFGAERGIEAFQRFGFLMRAGRMYLAAPLTRVPAKRNVSADVLDQLDDRGWLSRLRYYARSKEAPARLGSSVRRLEDAMFDVARSGGAPAIQSTLVAMGKLCAYLRDSPKTREACPPPPTLRYEWSQKADDHSAEFRIARALAGLHALDASPDPQIVLRMLVHFIPPVNAHGENWAEGDDHMTAWGYATLENNLAAVARRRLLQADRLAISDKPFVSRASTALSDVAALLDGAIDMDRVAELLAGLVLMSPKARYEQRSGRSIPALPGAYLVLKPLFCTETQLRDAKLLADGVRLPLTAQVVMNLAQNRPEHALDEAYHRCRIAGFPLLPRASAAGLDGPRLLTALLVPVATDDLKRAYHRFTNTPEAEPAASTSTAV
jgi:CRISPR-associated protein Csx17